MALTASDLITATAAAQRGEWSKAILAGKAAGSLVSGWMALGYPAAGAAPPAYTAGSGYACDDATTGALFLNLAPGTVNRVIGALVAAQVPGTLYVHDRLWACTGMGFAAATYTVTTPGNLPARITDNGVGVQAWCEVYAIAPGAASGTLTLNYVAPGGGAEVGVIPAVVSAPAISQIQPIPLQVGSTGVKQVTSVVTSATWTSGTAWGVTLTKPLFAVACDTPNRKSVAWSQVRLAQVPADACLMLIWQPSTVQAIYASGQVLLGNLAE